MGIIDIENGESGGKGPAYQWAGRTASRMLVGAQLRRHREAANVTREEAAKIIRASPSKISRLELGRTGFKKRDLSDLLDLYRVADRSERQTLLMLATQANRPGWWRHESDALPGWFVPYLGLEQAASVIRTYEVQFVPGLLQTEEYARAVIAAGPDNPSPALVDSRLGVRMRRQELLRRTRPPRLWAVIEEAVLRRPVGGEGTMRAQLRHLINAARLPSVTIQVLLTGAAQVPPGAPLTVLRFPEGELPDIVYMEHLFGAAYLEKPAETEPCLAAVTQLGMVAEPPASTGDIISEILTDM